MCDDISTYDNIESVNAAVSLINEAIKKLNGFNAKLKREALGTVIMLMRHNLLKNKALNADIMQKKALNTEIMQHYKQLKKKASDTAILLRDHKQSKENALDPVIKDIQSLREKFSNSEKLAALTQFKEPESVFNALFNQADVKEGLKSVLQQTQLLCIAEISKDILENYKSLESENHQNLEKESDFIRNFNEVGLMPFRAVKRFIEETYHQAFETKDEKDQNRCLSDIDELRRILIPRFFGDAEPLATIPRKYAKKIIQELRIAELIPIRKKYDEIKKTIDEVSQSFLNGEDISNHQTTHCDRLLDELIDLEKEPLLQRVNIKKLMGIGTESMEGYYFFGRSLVMAIRSNAIVMKDINLSSMNIQELGMARLKLNAVISDLGSLATMLKDESKRIQLKNISHDDDLPALEKIVVNNTECAQKILKKIERFDKLHSNLHKIHLDLMEKKNQIERWIQKPVENCLTLEKMFNEMKEIYEANIQDFYAFKEFETLYPFISQSNTYVLEKQAEVTKKLQHHHQIENDLKNVIAQAKELTAEGTACMKVPTEKSLNQALALFTKIKEMTDTVTINTESADIATHGDLNDLKETIIQFHESAEKNLEDTHLKLERHAIVKDTLEQAITLVERTMQDVKIILQNNQAEESLLLARKLLVNINMKQIADGSKAEYQDLRDLNQSLIETYQASQERLNEVDGLLAKHQEEQKLKPVSSGSNQGQQVLEETAQEKVEGVKKSQGFEIITNYMDLKRQSFFAAEKKVSSILPQKTAFEMRTDRVLEDLKEELSTYLTHLEEKLSREKDKNKAEKCNIRKVAVVTMSQETASVLKKGSSVSKDDLECFLMLMKTQRKRCADANTKTWMRLHSTERECQAKITEHCQKLTDILSNDLRVNSTHYMQSLHK